MNVYSFAADYQLRLPAIQKIIFPRITTRPPLHS
nr:MAG TPA: hypothetical protein [Caudoviricetes sp.]